MSRFVRAGEKRRGTVFADRYHARFIGSPTQARHAINYVLSNWRHHQADESWSQIGWDVDYMSSAPSFTGWVQLGPLLYDVPNELRLRVSSPQTWLLAKCWQRGGGPISMYEVPGR